MTTSQERRLSEVRSNVPLSARTIAYYRKRLRNRLHQLVLGKFMERGLKQADIKRRVGKDAAQITKWLRAPGNWTIDTASDLLIAMGYELEISVRDIARSHEYEVSVPRSPEELAKSWALHTVGELVDSSPPSKEYSVRAEGIPQIPMRPRMELAA